MILHLVDLIARDDLRVFFHLGLLPWAWNSEVLPSLHELSTSVGRVTGGEYFEVESLSPIG